MRDRALLLLLTACSSPSPEAPDTDGGSLRDGGARDANEAAPDAPGSDAGTTADAGELPPPMEHSCEPTRFVTTGADGSGDGSAERPWTLAQAMADATAGEVVLVGPGVYTAAARADRYAPAWSPAHSGEEGAPLVFCAEYPAVYNARNRSELRNDASDFGDEASPTFGVQAQHHVVWDGFFVDEAESPSHSDTGPVIVVGAHHVTIARSVVEGATIVRDDNHNAIRIDSSYEVLLANNRLSGVHDATRPNRNHAAIMLYDTEYLSIHHNEIFDCDAAIYLKGDVEWDPRANGAHDVRFNHIHDVPTLGVIVHSVTRVGDRPTVIAQNLIERARIGVMFTAVAADHPEFVRIHHNTIVGGESAFFPNSASTLHDFHVTENLIHGGVAFQFEFDEAALRTVIANGYLSDDNHAHAFTEWGMGLDLPEWQTFSGLDGESSTGDPMFVDLEGGDYDLRPGSPAATATASGGPAGCYITGTEHIGIEPAP